MAIVAHSSSAAAAAFNIPVGHRISWGAILAGVSLFIALSWLMLLLGSAIGVGIADATDLSAMGDGLGIGSIVWILLSTVIATFAGGLLAAKMAGTVDDRIGALHGLSVWSVGTLVIILLGASGVGGIVNSISGAVGAASNVSASAIAKASSSAEKSEQPNALGTSIAAIIKRQASSILSNTASGANSPEQAAVSQSISDMTGPQVNAQEVNSALNDLEPKVMLEAGQYLIMGKPEMAKDVLAVNTRLSADDIQAIVDGAEKEAKQMINKAKAEINAATETIATYTQAVLWSAFIAAALGLLAGLIGGHLGAGAIRRVYAVQP